MENSLKAYAYTYMKEFKWSDPITEGYSSYTSHASTKCPDIGMGFHLGCWSLCPIDSQTLQAIASALGYHPELGGKTLCKWVVEKENLILNQPGSFRPTQTSIVLEGAVHRSQREIVITCLIQLWTLKAKLITGQTRHVHWFNSGINIMEVFNYIPIAFQAHFTKWNPYLASYQG